MKELKEMVQQLREALEIKQQALQERLEGIDSYTLGDLVNRKKEIDLFEEQISHVDRSPIGRKLIIANFERGKQDILDRISAIGSGRK